ncbi:MAG: ribosomal protection-like ABC-F family protein [Minisyncoccota bacterium]
MLTLKNIWKRYGTTRVLERVSFSVGERQKVALVGLNGTGKSTLLKIIADIETPERGEIIKPNRVLTGYLSQEALAETGETVAVYLRRMAGLQDLEHEMHTLEEHLDQIVFLQQYELVRADYERLGGYDFSRKAQRVLRGLRLADIADDRLVCQLSGGEKRKLALAGSLLRGADLLLLDEPTNNLDLPALLWLERYLLASRATCIIASHDRRFLDHVARKVLEIDWFRRDVVLYGGGWSEYAEMKAHLTRKHKEDYRMQEEERNRLEKSIAEKIDWVDRLQAKKAPDHDTMGFHYKKERAERKFTMSAKALQGRKKRMDTVEKLPERVPLDIPFNTGLFTNHQGDVTLKNTIIGYTDGFHVGPFDWEIPYGSRIALLGNNGVGKTTLLKTITKTIPLLGGTIHSGEQVVFGYLMQEYENIVMAKTPMDAFKRWDIVDRDRVMEHLARFQFPPTVLDEKITFLSPGERVRLILALLSLRQVTFLILDEPTNHLDLETIEALEEALNDYAGTLLLVTHDRDLLEHSTMTQYYVLREGKLIPIADYDAYAIQVS